MKRNAVGIRNQHAGGRRGVYACPSNFAAPAPRSQSLHCKCCRGETHTLLRTEKKGDEICGFHQGMRRSLMRVPIVKWLQDYMRAGAGRPCATGKLNLAVQPEFADFVCGEGMRAMPDALRKGTRGYCKPPHAPEQQAHVPCSAGRMTPPRPPRHAAAPWRPVHGTRFMATGTRQLVLPIRRCAGAKGYGKPQRPVARKANSRARAARLPSARTRSVRIERRAPQGRSRETGPAAHACAANSCSKSTLKPSSAAVFPLLPFPAVAVPCVHYAVASKQLPLPFSRRQHVSGCGAAAPRCGGGDPPR